MSPSTTRPSKLDVTKNAFCYRHFKKLAYIKWLIEQELDQLQTLEVINQNFINAIDHVHYLPRPCGWNSPAWIQPIGEPSPLLSLAIACDPLVFTDYHRYEPDGYASDSCTSWHLGPIVSDLLESIVSTYPPPTIQQTKTPAPLQKKSPRSVITISSDEDGSEEEPPSSKGKACTQNQDDSPPPSPIKKLLTKIHRFLKQPEFLSNPTNTSSSCSGPPPLTYDYFHELMQEPENLNDVMEEIQDNNPIIFEDINASNSYAQLTTLFEWDYYDLEEQHWTLVQLIGSQGLLLKRFEENQMKAKCLAWSSFCSIFCTNLIRAAPNFFKHIQPLLPLPNQKDELNRSLELHQLHQTHLQLLLPKLQQALPHHSTPQTGLQTTTGLQLSPTSLITRHSSTTYVHGIIPFKNLTLTRMATGTCHTNLNPNTSPTFATSAISSDTSNGHAPDTNANTATNTPQNTDQKIASIRNTLTIIITWLSFLL